MECNQQLNKVFTTLFSPIHDGIQSYANGRYGISMSQVMTKVADKDGDVQFMITDTVTLLIETCESLDTAESMWFAFILIAFLDAIGYTDGAVRKCAMMASKQMTEFSGRSVQGHLFG